MNLIVELDNWYQEETTSFVVIPFVKAVFNQEITSDAYSRFLIQYYHFVNESSPVLSFAASRIPQDFKLVRDWLYQTAYKEASHGEFILADLKAFGILPHDVRRADVLPEMDALIGYNYHFSLNHHPVGILGTPYLMGLLSNAYSSDVARKLQQRFQLSCDDGVSFFVAHGHLDQDQPSSVLSLIKTITDEKVQREILFNARTVFRLYKSFLISLGDPS